MVRLSIIITGLMMIFIVNPLNAQRLLGGQKAVELSIATPFKNTIQINKNYSFSIALTSNTKKGNYWRFGGNYNHKTMNYKQREIPYDLYQGEVGYFLQMLTNYRRNFIIFTGISAIGGYEVFNDDKTILQDGAMLKNESKMVYGVMGTLSLEVYVSNHFVIGAFAKTKYLQTSDFNPFQSEFGIQTRFFIN